MTEPPVDREAPTAKLPPPPRERVRPPGPLPVIAGSFGLFFAITALLAFQLRAGADPALGEGEPQLVAKAPEPRKVLIRRVIVTRVVRERSRSRAASSAPATSGGAAGSTAGAAGSAGSSGGAPGSSARAAGSSPAPAPATPAPAPAPAPAPLTTRSS